MRLVANPIAPARGGGTTEAVVRDPSRSALLADSRVRRATCRMGSLRRQARSAPTELRRGGTLAGCCQSLSARWPLELANPSTTNRARHIPASDLTAGVARIKAVRTTRAFTLQQRARDVVRPVNARSTEAWPAQPFGGPRERSFAGLDVVFCLRAGCVRRRVLQSMPCLNRGSRTHRVQRTSQPAAFRHT